MAIVQQVQFNPLVSEDDGQQPTPGGSPVLTANGEIEIGNAIGMKSYVRFPNIIVPGDATITEAIFRVIATTSSVSGSTVDVAFHDVDDSTIGTDIDSLPLTTAVNWATVSVSPGQSIWPYEVSMGNSLQEIIDRPGWVEGNAVTVIMTGTLAVPPGSEVNFAAWDNGYFLKPQLTIKYVPAAVISDPVITILGENPYNVLINTIYVDPGATAIDGYGNPLAVIADTSAVNINIVGSYEVIYTAEDAEFRLTQEIRTVNVSESVIIGPTPLQATPRSGFLTDNFKVDIFGGLDFVDRMTTILTVFNNNLATKGSTIFRYSVDVSLTLETYTGEYAVVGSAEVEALYNLRDYILAYAGCSGVGATLDIAVETIQPVLENPGGYDETARKAAAWSLGVMDTTFHTCSGLSYEEAHAILEYDGYYQTVLAGLYIGVDVPPTNTVSTAINRSDIKQTFHANTFIAASPEDLLSAYSVWLNGLIIVLSEREIGEIVSRTYGQIHGRVFMY